MPIERHGVVLVPFPFTDRTSQKRRPAVVLSEPCFQRSTGNLLLAMITSAKQSHWHLDWPINDLEAAGLPQLCLVSDDNLVEKAKQKTLHNRSETSSSEHARSLSWQWITRKGTAATSP